MKLIQAMKQIKDLQVKAEDLRRKVRNYSADLSNETPAYENQKDQLNTWLQAHSDIVKNILDLRIRIQKTNLSTVVGIDIGGVAVTKTIAEWIHRRKDLATLEQTMWAGLTDKNLKEGIITLTNNEKQEVKLRRYYDPSMRDQKIELYRNEPFAIDSTLEVINATTDLLD